MFGLFKAVKDTTSLGSMMLRQKAGEAVNEFASNWLKERGYPQHDGVYCMINDESDFWISFHEKVGTHTSTPNQYVRFSFPSGTPVLNEDALISLLERHVAEYASRKN